MAALLEAREKLIEEEQAEAEELFKQQAEEKAAIFAEMERLKEEHEADVEQKLIRADAEVSHMRDQLNDAEVEFKFIAQTIREKQTEFEEESTMYAQYVKDVEVAYGQSNEINAELEEVTNQCKARQEQISQTEAIIESMESEAENTTNMMHMADEKQGLQYHQQLAQLRQEMVMLRHDRSQMEKEKLNMQQEAAEMDEKIYRLKEKTAADEK